MTTFAAEPGVEPATPVAPPRIRIDFIDGIRALAALQVVFFHFIGLKLDTLPPVLRRCLFWTQFGHIAVNVFIVLSGYCLMLPVVQAGAGQLRGGTVNFFKRRARRILPPYYAAFGLSLIALALFPSGATWQNGISGNFTWDNILAHIILIHNLLSRWHDTVNIALWSIATEWQIYFLFPFLLLPVWRRFGNGGLIVVASSIGIVFPLLRPAETSFNVACPWYIGLFAFGMIAAVVGMLPSLPGKPWLKTLPLAVIVLSIISLLAKHYFPGGYVEGIGFNFKYQWVKDLLIGAATALFLVYCTAWVTASGEPRRPLVLRVLENNALVSMGRYSYSLYLIHGVTMIVFDALLLQSTLAPVPRIVLSFFVGVPVTIACSYLFYLGVERKFMSKPGRSIR